MRPQVACLFVLLVGCSSAERAPRIPAVHRAVAEVCSHQRPPGRASGPDAGQSACSSDEGCTSGANGRCDTPEQPYCAFGQGCPNACSYDACYADSDCPAARACSCRESPLHEGPIDANFCLADGNCLRDSDCPGGNYCSPSRMMSCTNFGAVGWFCHTPDDDCTDDADCTGPGTAACAFDPVGARWRCTTQQCFDG